MNARQSHLKLIITVIVAAILMITCGPAGAGAPYSTEPPPVMPETMEPGTIIETSPPQPVETTPPQTIVFPPPVEGQFECKEEGANMLCTIGANQDMIVYIPFQPEHASYLYAVNLPVGDWQSWYSDRDEFRPHRVVANFELVLDPSNSENFISSFTPPITLGVRYYDVDVFQVGDLEKLGLGFWDEYNSYWVSFARHEKYQSKTDGDQSGGYIWVTISSWGDRHIGFDGD